MSPADPHLADPQDGTPHWRDYPVGRSAELSMSVVATLTPFLVGILGLFGAILVLGLTAEEYLLPSPELNRAIDQFARFSLAPISGFAWLAGLAVCVALLHRDVAVSRAVDAAARAGAPRSAVPAPDQVERVTSTPGWGLLIFAGFHAACLALVVVIGFFVILFDPFPEGWLVLLVGLTATAVFTAAAVAVHRTFRPAHRERKERIASWWTTSDEKAAWARARAFLAHESGGPGQLGRIRLGTLITHLGTLLVVASVGLLYVVLLITHPDAQRWPGGQAGPRALLSEEGEARVDFGVTIVAVLMVVGLLLCLLGTVVEGLAHLRERSFLRHALADPDADRPPARLIERYLGRGAPHLAQAMAAASGACVCLGTTGLALGRIGAGQAGGTYGGAADVYADLAPSFLLVLGIGVVLLVPAFAATVVRNLRGVGLRNELLARWPLRPSVVVDRENPPPLARVGPALSAAMDATAPKGGAR